MNTIVVITVFALCVLAPLSGVHADGHWEIVDKNFAAVGLSVSFRANLSGWVAGGSADGKPLLLHTDDGGKTLTNDPVADATKGELLSIDFYDVNHGIAGALGAGGLPCGVYTNDGKTWLKVQDGVDILCAIQDVKAPVPGTFVMIGEFSHPLHLGGDGIQISVDGGKSWEIHNWKQNISARYGWFLSAKIGYLTGGEWPNNNNSRIGRYPRQLSHHLHHDGRNLRVNTKSSADVSGYQGVIALTIDSGKSWKTLVNWTTEGVYFNEISCTDQNNCWVVAEGINKTTGVSAGYIYATNDGFVTIKLQQYFEHGSLVAVNMISPTFGWAGGADLRRSGISLFKGTFFLTKDGKTWTQFQQIPNFYAYDISTVNEDYAYSSGLDDLAEAELVQFAPTN